MQERLFPLPDPTKPWEQIMEDIVADFFAFQAAACTADDDCECGRPEHDEVRDQQGRTREEYECDIADGLNDDLWAEEYEDGDIG